MASGMKQQKSHLPVVANIRYYNSVATCAQLCDRIRREVMKRWLVIPLVLLLLQRADSQNMVVGNALPCGEDNLSCTNVPTTCLTADQICNGNNDCSPGSAIDEGGELFASLDCK